MSKAYDSNTQQQINRLEADLKRYDKAIKENRPNLANSYNLKGKTLKDLGQYTGNKSYYDQAVAAYIDALKYSPSNSQYLIEISNLHALTGRHDMATEAMIQASLSSSSTGESRSVLDMYIANKTRDLLKLEAIQQEINNLIQKKELPSTAETEFLNIIQDIQRVEQASREYTVISSTGDDINKLKTQIGSITKILATLQQQYSTVAQTPQIISSLQIHLQNQIEALNQHQKETDERLKKLESFKEITEVTIKKIEANENISKSEKAAMVGQINGIIKKIEGLAKKEDVDTITTLVTKLNDETQFTKDSLDAIDQRVDTLVTRQNESKLQLEEKLSVMQKALGELQAKISAVSDSEISKTDKVEMTEQINSIAQTVQFLVSRNDNIDTIVASVRDLEQVGQQTKGKLRDLQKTVKEIVDSQPISSASSSSSSSSSSFSSHSTTTLYYIDEIIYDNQLLNHPNLFGKLMGRFSPNEIINLSQRLSGELISEAIEHNNSELVLAGLVSLAESNLEIN